MKNQPIIAIIGGRQYFRHWVENILNKQNIRWSEFTLFQTRIIHFTDIETMRGFEVIDVIELPEADENLLMYAHTRIRQEIK